MSQGGQIYDFNNVTKFLKNTHTTHKNILYVKKNNKMLKYKNTNIRC